MIVSAAEEYRHNNTYLILSSLDELCEFDQQFIFCTYNHKIHMFQLK